MHDAGERLRGGVWRWLGGLAFRRLGTRVALAATSLATPRPAAGQPAGAATQRGPELLAALRGGGFILYFRHADTDHRENDAPMQSMEGCANQANLTERGREHVRAIGEAIRALVTPIGLVLTSPMCRTMETAMLTFGAAERAGGARRG